MATSNSYEFGLNTNLDDFIREAYSRLKILPDLLTGYHAQAAILSANLELTAWQGRVPLQWTRKRFMISLYVNQPIYKLPRTISRLVDVAAIQPQRLNSGGTAFSTELVAPGTSAANCFNPNATAGCVQEAPNGAIGYNYGTSTPSIQYVGIQPLAVSTYKLAIEYSFDNAEWFLAYQTPSQSYQSNQVIWFVIENSLNALSWRIRETDGGTLAIQQIYFSVPTVTGTGDRYLLGLSYTEWMQIPTKNSQGFPSSYLFNAQIEPTLTLWPVLGPSAAANQFTALLMTAYFYSQDVGTLINTLDLPQRAYDALIARIAYRLAIKFNPELAPLLKPDADEALALALSTDQTDVPLRIQPDFLTYS